MHFAIFDHNLTDKTLNNKTAKQPAAIPSEFNLL